MASRKALEEARKVLEVSCVSRGVVITKEMVEAMAEEIQKGYNEKIGYNPITEPLTYEQWVKQTEYFLPRYIQNGLNHEEHEKQRLEAYARMKGESVVNSTIEEEGCTPENCGISSHWSKDNRPHKCAMCHKPLGAVWVEAMSGQRCCCFDCMEKVL